MGLECLFHRFVIVMYIVTYKLTLIIPIVYQGVNRDPNTQTKSRTHKLAHHTFPSPPLRVSVPLELTAECTVA